MVVFAVRVAVTGVFANGDGRLPQVCDRPATQHVEIGARSAQGGCDRHRRRRGAGQRRGRGRGGGYGSKHQTPSVAVAGVSAMSVYGADVGPVLTTASFRSSCAQVGAAVFTLGQPLVWPVRRSLLSEFSSCRRYIRLVGRSLLSFMSGLLRRFVFFPGHVLTK